MNIVRNRTNDGSYYCKTKVREFTNWLVILIGNKLLEPLKLNKTRNITVDAEQRK